MLGAVDMVSGTDPGPSTARGVRRPASRALYRDHDRLDERDAVLDAHVVDDAEAHIEKLIVFYTEREDEDVRLDTPIGRLELARLTIILAEHLPASSTILDVGGGTGRIAAWLTEQGHHVRLIDPVSLLPRSLSIAAQQLSRCSAGDRPTTAAPHS